MNTILKSYRSDMYKIFFYIHKHTSQTINEPVMLLQKEGGHTKGRRSILTFLIRVTKRVKVNRVIRFIEGVEAHVALVLVLLIQEVQLADQL